MKAVVLAAGLGRRLKLDLPKPLLKVAGKEILYRNLCILSDLGVKEFVVVASSEEIGNFLTKHGFRHKVIWNNSPEKGNGYSLYLAENHIDGDFILIMGDHVYERAFIERAVRGKGLIGDRIAKFININEATKVVCANGWVVKVGKGLEKYDYIDTGLFILTPEIFRHAKAVIAEKDRAELSEIIERAKLPVTEVSGFFWMDIDTPEDLRRARREIIRTSVKLGDGLVARAINRRISTRISERIVDHVTPNQITFFTFLLGILSVFLVLINKPLAGILYQLSSIIDGVDGEIARASMKASELGGWLDSILDRYVDFLFLLALALSIAPRMIVWMIVALAIFGSLMVSYSTERYKAAFSEDIYKLSLMKLLVGKRDERIFLIMLFCLFGWIFELFVLLAVITNLRVILTMGIVWRYKKINSYL
jgi:CDP-L-myo-inositol myo-inositolphosphotransferase